MTRYGSYALTFVAGVMMGALGNAVYELVKFTARAIDQEPTNFSVSLADLHCAAGSIGGLVRQRQQLRQFDTDGLAEHTRICANHNFVRGSTDHIVYQVKQRFRKCFDLKFESSMYILQLKSYSSNVCRSGTQSRAGTPVYYCLEQPADPKWEEDRSLDAPRVCPAKVEEHFSKRYASPEIPEILDGTPKAIP